MRDVLKALPAETPIVGVFGDHGSYRAFTATAGTVREVLSAIYEEGVRHNADLRARFPDHPILGREHTPGCHLVEREGECVATLLPPDGESLPAGGWTRGDGLRLILDCRGDARTEPWYVQGVRFDFEAQSYGGDGASLEHATAKLRAVLAALESVG